jgi:small-conductance mechanosensitive channel
MSGTEQGSALNDLMVYIEPVTGFFGDYPLAIAAIVLLLAVIVANLAVVIVTRVAGRIAERTRFHWDDQLIAALRRPVFWSLLLIGCRMALLPLEPSQTVSTIFESAVASILIILWSMFLLRFIRIVLRAFSTSAGEKSIVRKQTLPLFENLGFIIVIVIMIYMVFRSWHVDMTAWIASAGIAGIAIGFAAKDTLANLFSGVFILADTPYKIGDYVVLDSGERGMVTHIGIRSTRLLTRDDVEITIPNAIMGNTRITNESGGPHEKYRLRVKVGVAYGSDIDQVKQVLMDIAVAEPSVCADPEPRVRFRNFGGSSLDLELLCWADNPELRGRVLDVLNTTIYKRFNSEGIEIPYSKHDVFIKEMPHSTQQE